MAREYAEGRRGRALVVARRPADRHVGLRLVRSRPGAARRPRLVALHPRETVPSLQPMGRRRHTLADQADPRLLDVALPDVLSAVLRLLAVQLLLCCADLALLRLRETTGNNDESSEPVGL